MFSSELSVRLHTTRALALAGLAVSLAILAACGSLGTASGDSVSGEDVGVLRAQLTAPSDGCMSITARSILRDTSGQFQVKAGVDTQMVLDGIPLTSIAISGEFFGNTSCTGQPLYTADPVTVELSPQQPTGQVTLVFQGNGSIVINGTFEGQPTAILVDDFSGALDPMKWNTLFNSGANVFVDPQIPALELETIPNTGCGSAKVNGIAQAEIVAGRTLIFESVVAAYHDQSIYGDHQPRGLRSGTDANNAIEFVSAFPVPNTITCRSVNNGVATETTVGIGNSVSDMNTYHIEARNSSIDFFVNGSLVCQHTTNIPTALPLNPFFSTSDDCLGNVPVVVNKVEFEIQ